MPVTTDFQPDIQAASAAVPALPSAEVLGVRLALTDYERVMDWMDAMIAAGQQACVSAAAVHLVMVAQEDPETAAAVFGSDDGARWPAAGMGTASARPS